MNEQKSHLPFGGFFLAGFECATGFNVHRHWIDQVAATQHDVFAWEDYENVAAHGFAGVREAVRWPLVNHREGVYDFSSLDPFLEASRDFGLTVVWDLFHFGYPHDVNLFSPDLPKRFANYCANAARYISERTEGPCFFTPVNEPSFFAWAAGDACLFAPHLCGKSFDLKVALIRAAIAGINAIWKVCPSAQIVNVDAMCRVVPPSDRPDLHQAAHDFNQHAVFQSWDMLAGRLHPELGGSKKHLGMIGINYYWTNQWELESPDIPLGDDDPRCASLSELIETVWERYGNEILISETSHVAEHRAPWLDQLAAECVGALSKGIPLRGACIYPIIGMPEWHAIGDYTPMGLWDLVETQGTLRRKLYQPMARALKRAHVSVEDHFAGTPSVRKTSRRGEIELI